MVSMMMRNLVMSSLSAPDAVERFEERMFDLASQQEVDIRAEDVAGLEDLGERYVRETLRLLEACVTAADQARIRDMVAPVLAACERFFMQHDQRVPDQGGLFGLICNGYMARGLLELVSEQTRQNRGFPLLATDPHAEAEIIISLIGADVAETLDVIVDEVYLTPQVRFAAKNIYGLTGSLRATGRVSEWEARWEDRIAAFSAETGIAFTTAA